MKNHVYLEETDIPAYEENDVLIVIERAKAELQKKHIQKKEASMFQTVKQILYLDGWKSLFVQTIVIVAGLIIIWSTSSIIWTVSASFSSRVSIALLSVGGTIMATVIAVELIRNDIYGMREVEMTCSYSIQRLLIWKMLFLSLFAIFGIALFSYAVTLKSNIDYMVLLSGGCIPFLIMNACTLLLHTHKNPLYTLSIFFLCALALLCVLEYSYIDNLLSYLESWGQCFMLLLLLCNIVLIALSSKRRYVI